MSDESENDFDGVGAGDLLSYEELAEQLGKVIEERDKLKARNEEIDTWDVDGCMILLNVAKRIVQYRVALLAGEWDANSIFMRKLVDDCQMVIDGLGSREGTATKGDE